MLKIKTSELQGAALDWAVAKCEGKGIEFDDPADPWLTRDGISDQPLHSYTPSTDWAQGGPFIERREIGIRRNMPCSKGREWEAIPSITAKGAGGKFGYGPTPLVAAMRCYVASHLGNEVDIPEELV
jgi:hypothetical protein